LRKVLSEPASQALAHVAGLGIMDPELLRIHGLSYPERYQMPENVSTYLLATTAEKRAKMLQTCRALQVPPETKTTDDVIAALLAAGANPVPFFARGDVTVADMKKLLPACAGAPKSYEGFTIAHTRCLDKNFVHEMLPVLMDNGVDINSTPTTYPVGTIGHLMLANEHYDEALAYVKSPDARPILDPARRDGEDKTLPIIAAKMRAEDVLIALADLYPEKLDLNARDEDGRTVMHICFGLGLRRAAARLMELNPDMEIVDNKGRNPGAYLNLSPQETSNLLKSIELHPDRDAGAWRNAIVGNEKAFLPVLINNRPVLATKQNMGDPNVERKALAQFGEAGVEVVRTQRMLMKGMSLLDSVLKDRAALKRDFESGLLTPSKSGEKRRRRRELSFDVQ
jgi:hypothetical protein